MKAAVVILNWNGRNHLARFLSSVVEHTPAAIDIVVADNGSSDDSVEFIRRKYPSVRLILLDKNYGFATGYNLALRQIKADCYILLNSDVEVTAGWTAPLLSHMQEDRWCGAVAPKLLSYTERDKFEYAGAAGGFIDYLGYPFCRGRILSKIEQDKGQYDDAREVFWASGAAFCCRAELFHALGGFDDDFFAHMEEIDLCWRMQLAGYKIMVEPKSVVYHLGGGSLAKESSYKLFLNYRNNLTMLMKCAPTSQRIVVAIVRPIADMCSALIYLISGKRALASATWKAYKKFFASHKAIARKRKAVRSAACCESRQIYRGSIIARYAFGWRKFGKML